MPTSIIPVEHQYGDPQPQESASDFAGLHFPAPLSRSLYCQLDIYRPMDPVPPASVSTESYVMEPYIKVVREHVGAGTSALKVRRSSRRLQYLR
jgi:hypothetical protein